MTEATWDQRQADVALAQASAVTAREVFAQHLPFVWRTLRCQNVAPRDVEDVAQEVFVVIFRKLPHYEERGQIRAWIYRICLRAASTYRRRARVRREVLVHEIPEPPPVALLAADVERFHASEQLMTLIATLDEDKRAVFALHEIRAAPDRRGRRDCRLPTRDRLLAPRCREEAARRRARQTLRGRDMKGPTQDPETLLATLVRASRATPTAEQAERLERRLTPWLDPKPGIPLRPLYAATAVLAVLGLGLVVQPYAESAGTLAKRDASASIATPRATFVRDEAPTAPEKARVETPPSPLVVATKAPVARPVDELPARVEHSSATKAPVGHPVAELPAGASHSSNASGVASAELAAAPEEAVPPPLATRREPEVDFLRRAQAALASSPSEALKMANNHPSVYPRGVLAQEREVIAIDALARLGRRREAALRAEAFRSAFPRSAH